MDANTPARASNCLEEPLLVSNHLPKTAGSTLREILRTKYGDRLQLAYNEKDGHPVVDNPACVHGHDVFRFQEVLNLRKNQIWFVFLRHPLRSAISFYYYSLLKPEIPFTEMGLVQWLTKNKDFSWPDPPNYNHNRFSKRFGKRPFEAYDFVGLTDRFDESMFLLFHHLGWEPIPYEPANVGKYAKPDLPAEAISRFEELNNGDYELYHRASERLNQMKQDYGPSFAEDFAGFKTRLGRKT